MIAASTASELALDLPAEASSVTAARRATVEWARLHGVPTDDIALAVSEAVGNAVLHAFKGRGSGTIRVHGRERSDRLVVTVTDDGSGMTPNLDSPGLGLGISLLSKLAKDVRIHSTGEGTTVSMSFGLGPVSPGER